MTRLWFDFEVFSELNLKAVPRAEYNRHVSTKIILCAYAIDDGEVKTWEQEGTTDNRKEFVKALKDPSVILSAWNVGYERGVLQGRGIDIPLSRCSDPMVNARYAGFPGQLKVCAKIPMLGVPTAEATKNETLLITKFCMPNKKGGRTMPKDSPSDWSLFVDYCRKDVLTMRHIGKWVEERFPLPDRERRLWELDQVINERGIPVDVEMARHGITETNRLAGEALRRMAELTGIENPNSVQQLLPWLTERGYIYDSLGKEFLQQSLDGLDLTKEAAEVIRLRLDAAKTSVKKFAVIAEKACA